jgi:hypothetical protein
MGLELWMSPLKETASFNDVLDSDSSHYKLQYQL